MSTRIAFIVFVVCIAWSALHHEPAKIQDRMVTDGDRRFCGFYYAWRETQDGGGPVAIDRLCFDAQEMRP
jgi:hypothetical protein